MYSVSWDPETNGILFTTEEEGDVKQPIRPVFFEELDLLGFDKLGFSYPNCEAPIMWAAGTSYYYRGQKIAERRGGDFYHEVSLSVFTNEFNLQPVNLTEMIQKNGDKIATFTHDSIDFIRKTIDENNEKIDCIVVSFSGGKDSIVTAELVKRALLKEDFVIVFAETTLESEYTYAYINDYIHKNPNLTYIRADYGTEQKELWNIFGPPSRIHRWCHTLYKIAPIRKTLTKHLKSPTARILLIDGIRHEESGKRGNYENISYGTKGMLQINISPILQWSSAEVFTYIFASNIPLNKMYRYGYARVGCLVCPYSSKWSEYLSNKLFCEKINPYLTILKDNAIYAGKNEIEKYICEGGWKSRSGGLDLPFGGNFVDFSFEEDNLIIHVSRKNNDLFWKWLICIGNVVRNGSKGTVKIGEELIEIIEIIRQSSTTYKILGIGKDIKLVNIFKKIGHKTAYCVACGACESVCPSGALLIEEKELSINSNLCINCMKCFNYVEKGCWVAKSISYVGYSRVKKMDEKGINRYQGFGFETRFMQSFLNGNEWLDSDHSDMGIRQIEGFKKWLEDAEIRNKSITELGQLFLKLSSIDDHFMWAVIWNNLAYNSTIIEWYCKNISKSEYSKKDLIYKLATSRGYTESNRTHENAITSLIATLVKSPIGFDLKQGEMTKQGNKAFYLKSEPSEIHELALLYSIYRYGEHCQRTRLVLSELVTRNEVSPYTIYGLDYNSLKNILTKCASNYPDFVHVEFSGNLDNVNLSKSIKPIDIVKKYVEDTVKE